MKWRMSSSIIFMRFVWHPVESNGIAYSKGYKLIWNNKIEILTIPLHNNIYRLFFFNSVLLFWKLYT